MAANDFSGYRIGVPDVLNLHFHIVVLSFKPSAEHQGPMVYTLKSF